MCHGEKFIDSFDEFRGNLLALKTRLLRKKRSQRQKFRFFTWNFLIMHNALSKLIKIFSATPFNVTIHYIWRISTNWLYRINLPYHAMIGKKYEAGQGDSFVEEYKKWRCLNALKWMTFFWVVLTSERESNVLYVTKFTFWSVFTTVIKHHLQSGFAAWDIDSVRTPFHRDCYDMAIL